MISIIVPTYNHSEELKKCLAAIADSALQPHEVIVVDDVSEPPVQDIVEGFGYRYIRLESNSGQATARNVGANHAGGDILFFIDSDVIIRKDTLQKVADAYLNSEVQVYQGLASPMPSNGGFGPKLMALKWFYMMKDVTEASFVHSHVFSIRKSVFEEVGGFDPQFKPPGGGEEFELGHRLRKKYVIHTDPELLVEHRFPGVFARARTLYYRTYVWASLFDKTRKFEKTNASGQESIAGLCNVAWIFLLFLSCIHREFLAASFLFLACQTVLNLGFYRFIAREQGLLFMFRSVFPNMLWSLTQMAAALKFYFDRLTGTAK